MDLSLDAAVVASRHRPRPAADRVAFVAEVTATTSVGFVVFGAGHDGVVGVDDQCARTRRDIGIVARRWDYVTAGAFSWRVALLVMAPAVPVGCAALVVVDVGRGAKKGVRTSYPRAVGPCWRDSQVLG
jgi:hypothetical protein